MTMPLKLFKSFCVVFLISVVFTSKLPAQENTDKIMVVIAVNGVKLRTQPDIHSKILSYLNFGTGVEVLKDYQDDLVVLDTLKVGFLNEDIEINGYWKRVRYDTLEGYVFGAYLAPKSYVLVPDDDINKDYVILFSGWNQGENMFYNQGWNYYSIYHKKEYTEVRKVSINYLMSSDGMGYMLYADPDKKELFIIASAKKLPTGRVKSYYYTDARIQPVYFTQVDTLINPYLKDYALQFEPVSSDQYVNGAGKLRVFNSKISQTLNFYSNDGLFIPFEDYIQWIGDLDGDSVYDYVISTGNKGSDIYLYLSAPAGKNEIVKNVSYVFLPYD